MALTPEDIVNKRFQSTKFREGYDQDEVDDFLDEVVVEMRRLVEENQSLRNELQAAEARIAELQRAGSSAASMPAMPTLPSAPANTGDPIDAEGTANLLQLARRLHEEHVREGIQKRDELIAEGHSQAARIVAEAEAEHKRKLAILDQERAAAEAKIEQLREFERDYRRSLRTFIEGQLGTLEKTGIEATVTPGSAG
jgi:DivIVA domain-containing protein